VDGVRFGRSVRALRRRKRWRQEDLAQDAGVSRTTISRIELGRGDRLTIRALDLVATALGARVQCWIDWNGEPWIDSSTRTTLIS
jgi:transcriptional regulator with XRE-family HTH domain